MAVRFPYGRLGWLWNGSACVQLPDGAGGCVGTDCDKLVRTEAECQALHAGCG